MLMSIKYSFLCNMWNLQTDTVRTKLHGNLIDEDGFEGSSGSLGADNGGAEEVYQKGRKYYGHKDDNEFDDGGEACSGTGEGLAVGSVSGNFDVEVANENIEQSSSQGKRKRNNKLFFRGMLSVPYGQTFNSF